MHFKLISSCVLSLSLIGCSQLTQQSQSKHQQSTPPTEKKTTPHSHTNGVQITPYQVPEIKREAIPVKNHSAPPQPAATPDGSEKPVFRQLIQQARQALQQNHLTQAEHFALQAQRISPQAAQSYVILAQIAQKQRNYNHAEALLQRGLSLANDNATKKQLWLIRLQIAQTQHNPNAIQQAKRALQQF
ncbi:hypothetical protein P255_01795 [Acinetobacter brisouii CIP 110357]|uniref:Uncharacterized protein n=1 Tax=Acinetobacter brisouii CIP 110357 TaxID=1341683 RepID=V2URN8_9GAMM|nr:hypothetical protein [Acinetobacter brisouii]ENV47741.1 hypothetical protein F954_00800 [Acinetobacter brisouii ANC 4119]ESK51285.1 hypothetical protein P255_01795 [Acinetobacter brisouii CIP 110357]